MPDIPADRSTTESIALGGSFVGSVETSGDHDWYRVTLTAGQTYAFLLNGTGADPLADPYLKLFDFGGVLVQQNDNGAGDGNNAKLIFTAPYSGTYYVDAGAWDLTSVYPPEENVYAGTYTLSLQTDTPAGLASLDQIADQLVNGYWIHEGSTPRHFKVSQGGNITFNIEALTPEGQSLALAALGQWSDIIGVTFQRVTTGSAQVTFDDYDSQYNGFATSVVGAQGIISTSTVVVPIRILDDYGTVIGGYSYQTYLHEIGHALGLGHAGNYNVQADYNHALFANDGLPLSVMSYFNQVTNPWFADQFFSYGNALTPMAADIVAMQQIYGLSTNTRSGDTSYGSFGPGIFNAAYPYGSFTIFDTDGHDIVDVSTFSASQVINLNPEAFSNVAGGIGNLVIARGVVIEDARGGFGNDALIGNASNNALYGGGGNDSLVGMDGDDFIDGGTGNDAVDGGAGDDRIIYDAVDDTALVTGGAGDDTLVVNDVDAPTMFNLVAQGFERAERIQHDTGTNSWTTVTSNYNSAWQMLSQDVRNDDGSRSYTAFDAAIAQVWDQVWFNYDAAGQQVSIDYRYDSGTRSWTALDPYNSQSWSQVWFTYNASGQQISEDYRYDDGKRSWVAIDATNAQNWSQVWFTYDPAGNKISEDYRYDDGGRSWVAFDATSARPWDHIWFTYDTLGRQTSEDRYNDNGTRVWTGYDAISNQAWSQDAFYYDASGRLYQQVTTWDDGHTSTTLF